MRILDLLYLAIADPDLSTLPKAKADQSQIDTIVGVVFSIAGALAFLFIVIGGLRYILSRGNPEGIAKAKNTILYALIGLLVTITSYGIISFVLNNI